MPKEMITFDSFTIPKTYNWIHCTTNYFAWRSITASAYPLFMSILLIIQFTHVFSALSAYSHPYKLYYRSPWSALPVTKLVFPTASEKTGCPWGGEHIIDSIGPFRHCDFNDIIIKNYGVTGSWTQGLVHAKHALYQLSYNPNISTSHIIYWNLGWR